jgi:type IV pilus assembly protein PilN
MIKINLLPWREELRQQKQKDFNNAFLMWIMFAITIFVGIHFYFDNQKTYQNQRNKMLQDAIAVLDKNIIQIKNIEESKKHLLNKIKVIHDLQRSRPETVHLFHEIPQLTPDSLFITKLTRMDRNLTFEGKSQSNALVSAFMIAIENSNGLQIPSLDIIKAQEKLATDKSSGNEKLQDFTLRTVQRDLPKME